MIKLNRKNFIICLIVIVLAIAYTLVSNSNKPANLTQDDCDKFYKTTSNAELNNPENKDTKEFCDKNFNMFNYSYESDLKQNRNLNIYPTNKK